MRMALLTLQEAARFLRVSKSTLYQRKDIPRYRLPGSRSLRFDEAELLAWAKGQLETRESTSAQHASSQEPTQALDNSTGTVYHRNDLYR